MTSSAFVGVEPCAVRVEAHVSGMGKAAFSIVGLPDAAVREARERVRSAMLASGFPFPGGRVTVNLAPADLPKMGSAYDLPIAFGLLAAARTIPPRACDVVALGELALDGSVRGSRGSLAAGLVARSSGLRCVVSVEAAAEGAEVEIESRWGRTRVRARGRRRGGAGRKRCLRRSISGRGSGGSSRRFDADHRSSAASGQSDEP